MVVAYTSDLHTDLCERNAKLVDAIAAHVARLAPDVFVIAGDVAERTSVVTESLRRFAAVRARKLYMPGNHDLFVEGDPDVPGAVSSREKYEKLLPLAAAVGGFEYLGLVPVDVGDVAIVGTPGWYDYSLRDRALDCSVSLSQYRTGQWRGMRAYDNGHVFWPRDDDNGAPDRGAQPASVGGRWASDEEIHAEFLAALNRQLVAVQDASKILAVVHVLPFEEIVARGAFGSTPFYDAYLGSAAIGQRLREEPCVRAVITGHLHRVLECEVAHFKVGAHPVGDARKSPLDIEALARERVGTFVL